MNELRLDGYAASKTITARIVNAAGQYFHVASSTFEAYGAGGHAAGSYDVALTDKGGGTYRGNFPAAIVTAGEYTAYLWDSAIAGQAVGLCTVIWDGTAASTLADLIEALEGGTGDHAVTLTIRTTGGTPLAGARIWLSTDNNRENVAQGVSVTDDSGQATFNLDYATTYYIHGHLAGYRFNSANFTPASGSVAFTKDIALSMLASGSASDYAEALLVRMVAAVRRWSDEPKLSAKYTDSWIIARAENVYALVLEEKQRQTQDPVIATIPIDVSGGATTHILPSTMGPVQAVYHLDGDWQVKYFYQRYSSQNPFGRGVWVEGNMLRLQSNLTPLGSTIYVECWPNGCARLHCGTCTLNAAGSEATFGATPYLGTLDRAVNAYAGSILRIFNVTGTTVTGNCIQERVISSYDWQARKATLAKALDPIPTTDDGYIFYEIAPQIPVGLDSILGMKVAWEICAVEQPKKAPGLLAIYQQNLRHLRLGAFAKQLQSAGQPDSDTAQNSAFIGAVW